MSHESPQPKPVNEGLSPEQEQVADHLTQQYRDATQAHEDHVPFVRPDNTRSERAALMLSRPIMRAVDTVVDGRLARKEKRTGEAAKKHYQAHENAYHTRALKMDAQRTATREWMDHIANASPEEVGVTAALMGYDKRDQQTLMQHTAERQTASRVTDEDAKERGISALEKVPGVDPVLAIVDGRSEEIPEAGWLVSSHIAPGYGGKIDVYRYGKGQIEFKDPSDNREQYGEVRLHFGIRGGDRHTIAYENPKFPGRDIEPYDRMSQTSYTGLDFKGTDIVPLSNGGRLLDEKTAMGERPKGINLFTSMDWRDFDRPAMREHSTDFPVNRVVADQEAIGPILAGLGEGMGLEAQDIETLVGTVGGKIEPAAA